MYGIGSPFSVAGGCSVYYWFHGVMIVSVDFVVAMSVSVDFVVETYSPFFGATFPVSVCFPVDVRWQSSGQRVVRKL